MTRTGFMVCTIVAVCAALLLGSGTSLAAPYTWTGTTSNAWALNSNWGGSGYPSAYGDTATIGVAANNPVSLTTTVLMGGGSTSLTLSNVASSATGLDIASAGILGMQGNIVLSSSTTNGRKITIEGILRNDAASSATTYTVTGGTNAGDILQLVGGTISSLNGGIWSFSRPVQGYGTLSAPFTNTSTISANSSGNTLHITGNSTAAGAMTSTGGGILSIESSLTGYSFASGTGTVDLNGATLNGTFTNNAANLTLTLTGDSTINGTINQNQYLYAVLNGHTLNFNSTSWGNVSGGSNPTITVGTGTLNNASGNSAISANGDTVTIAGGSITNNGGTFTFNPPLSGYGMVSGVSFAQQAITASGGTSGTPRTLTYNGGTGVTLGSHSGSGANMVASAFNTLDLQGIINYINPGFIAPSGGVIQLDGVTINSYDPSTTPNPTTWAPTISAGTVNVVNNSTLIGKYASSASFTIQSGKTLNINDNIANSGTTNFTSTGSVIGGNVAVGTNATLTSSGVLQVDALSGGGTLAVTGGTASLTQKGTSWPTNSAAVQNIGMLTVSGAGLVDVTNNLVNVNYGVAASPYTALAAQVNSAVITQSTAVPYRTVGIYDTALNLDSTTPGGTTVRLGYASPGDTMMRGQVDSSDILNILSAGKYGIGPSNARWDQGDFDHNGQVDSSDIIAMLASGVYNTGTSYAAEPAPLLLVGGPPSSLLATVIYDRATGDVKIDPDGNAMTGFRLRDSAGNFFVGSAVLPPGSAFITDTATEKFWSTFSPSSYLTSVFDLGHIAPTGLTDAQFLASMNNLSGDSVWTAAGGGSFNYNFTSVPEPTTLALLLLGGVGLARVRARRNLRTVR